MAKESAAPITHNPQEKQPERELVSPVAFPDALAPVSKPFPSTTVGTQPINVSMTVQEAFPETLPKTIPFPVPPQQPVRAVKTAEKAAPSRPIDTQRLAREVSHLVMKNLNNDAVLDHFLNAKELHADNRQLAYQVQHLLKEKRQLLNQLAYYEQQLASFKPIMGNVYLKID